jgi:hypothetical protein
VVQVRVTVIDGVCQGGVHKVGDTFKGLDDSRLKADIIDSTGHVGAMPTALYNGIRFVFGKR